MKTFTDLEQSKMLSEILPIESADMWWAERYAGKIENNKYIVEEKPVYYACFVKPSEGNISQDIIKDIPCWSLAALLKVLPEIINFDNDENDYKLEIEKENNLFYLSYGNILEHGKIKIEPQENFVNVCFEMLLKLHELKRI